VTNDKPFVYPELTDGKQWKVKPSKGMAAMTDPIDSIMLAPVDDDWLAGAVRLHEVAHATWTPRHSLDPTDPEMLRNGHATTEDLELLVQACEDRRNHHLLSTVVSDWPHYAKAMNDYVSEIDGLPDTATAQIALDLASRQTGMDRVINLDPMFGAIADAAEQIILDDPTNPKVTWEAAKLIRDVLAGEDESGEDNGDGKGDGEGNSEDSGECSDPDCDCHDDDYNDWEEEDEEDEDDYDEEDEIDPKSWLPKKAMPKKVKPYSPDRYNYEEERYSRWAEMEIDYPPLTTGIPKFKVMGRGRKAQNEGVVPRHIHRVATGGRIFSNKTKGKKVGGTVLIDVSGSMSIRDSDILRLLKQVHHGTVAIYSLSGSNNGRLSIIARNYRAVSEVPHFGSGNGVDGPALEWLGRQPEPRAWICDGGTTGYGDMPFGRNECSDHESHYRIKRYYSIDRYLEDKPSSGKED
jgi:hypothetical protein